jgi:hypothetical protein
VGELEVQEPERDAGDRNPDRQRERQTCSSGVNVVGVVGRRRQTAMLPTVG